MKKYKTTKGVPEIEAVECFRETEASVWVELKTSDYHTSTFQFRKVSETTVYHDTFEDAKNHLIKTLQGRLDHLKFAMDEAKGDLWKVNQLQSPCPF